MTDKGKKGKTTYRACDVIDNNCCLSTAIIHGRKRVVSYDVNIRYHHHQIILSCPAVSQISNFTVISLRQTVWVRNAAVDDFGETEVANDASSSSSSCCMLCNDV